MVYIFSIISIAAMVIIFTVITGVSAASVV